MLKSYFVAACLTLVCTAANAQTAAQTALLTETPMPAGSNGFAALNLLEYQLSAQQQAQWLTSRRTEPDWAKVHYDTRFFACENVRDVDACAAHVKAHLPQFQAALQQHRALLDNIDRLAAHDHISVPLHHQDTADTPFPNYSPLLFPTQAAVITEWLSGDTGAALSRSCRYVKLGRKMLVSPRPQGLVQSMIAKTLINIHLDTMAHIWASRPESARRLPESCADAFEPLAAEVLTLCQAMKYEYRFVRNTYTKLLPAKSAAARLAKRLDREHAEHLNRFCQANVLAQIRRDVPLHILPPRRQKDLASYKQYVWQMQDLPLRLNAVRALLQLYRLPAPPDDAAVQQVLAAHATPARTLTWNAAQGRIGFTLYRPHPQESANAFLPFNRQIR